MSNTRVFISSTCYDLKETRENVAQFIRDIGFEAILSDQGDVPYGHRVHTHDACLLEVEKSDILILIIGNRYGGFYKNTEKSITRMEYETAIKYNIPVYAYVRASTYGEHGKYIQSKKAKESYDDRSDGENTKIFEFIDAVRRAPKNNAIIPFEDDRELIKLLKKQFSGMVHELLQKKKEKLQHYHVHLKIEPRDDGRFRSSYFGSGTFLSPKSPARYVDTIRGATGDIKCEYYPNFSLLNPNEKNEPRNQSVVELVINGEELSDRIDIFGKVTVTTTLTAGRGGVGLHIPYDCDFVVFVVDFSLFDLAITEKPKARLLRRTEAGVERDYEALKVVEVGSDFFIVGKNLKRDENIEFSWGDHSKPN
jgi:hypothetical protein